MKLLLIHYIPPFHPSHLSFSFDGTAGNQPRGTYVGYNFVHEVRGYQCEYTLIYRMFTDYLSPR